MEEMKSFKNNGYGHNRDKQPWQINAPKPGRILQPRPDEPETPAPPTPKHDPFKKKTPNPYEVSF
jgi:hypothetical protein